MADHCHHNLGVEEDDEEEGDQVAEGEEEGRE